MRDVAVRCVRRVCLVRAVRALRVLCALCALCMRRARVVLCVMHAQCVCRVQFVRARPAHAGLNEQGVSQQDNDDLAGCRQRLMQCMAHGGDSRA